MDIKKVVVIYFSPTGTTQKAITAFGTGMGLPLEKIDLTTPKARQAYKRSFRKDELVIAGLPVYAGRLPWYLDDFFLVLRETRHLRWLQLLMGIAHMMMHWLNSNYGLRSVDLS